MQFAFIKEPCEQHDHPKTLAWLEWGVLLHLALAVGGENIAGVAVSHLWGLPPD